MGDEITEEEYHLIKKQRQKQEKLERKDKGDLKKPGKYLGPWAGYSGLTSESIRKEKLKKFTKIINKHCLNENKEITRSFKTALLSKNLNIRIYNPEDSYKETRIYKEHRDEITQLKFLSVYNAFVSGSLDGKVNLFSFGESDGLLKTFLGHSKGVSYVDTHRSDTLLCTGSYDKTFKIWNLTTSGKFLYKFNLKNAITYGTRWSNDIFYLGCTNGVISKIDLRSRDKVEDVFTMDNADFLENSVKNLMVVDESTLALNLYNGNLNVIDLRNTKEPLCFMKSRCKKMLKVDDLIVFIDEDNVLYEFEYNENKTTEIMRLSNKISSNVVSLNSKLFYTTSDSTFCTANIINNIEKSICSMNQDVDCLALNTPLCSYLAAGDKSGQITLYKSLNLDDF
ncbi:Pre-mRNA-processing factor 17 [Nosema bombycis CQ1]|uniref:Pre-mRNA-processing factor 17 n=1 Tax=Nosema bombycis (strain CQ1 / CVCC 102059) TaxID=578461 RepID=R0KSY4_NOSB1|nr:Pre-mRNA-processing factor 17 [Nosema bombycis CQ1]|eukprot:EOB13337.1 Pre-mRNA-processing factor 17 [Nosema bombycis CQ1]